MVANAARRAADLAHLRQALEPEHPVEELADRALLALQGPRAAEVLGRLCPSSTRAFMRNDGTIGGRSCRISRCGYTGEDGFEISVAAADAEALARLLLDQPEVAPAGLGAARLAPPRGGRCLYGHELTADITPVEAGLGWTIAKRRRREANFPGADVILRRAGRGARRRLVEFAPTAAPRRARARRSAIWPVSHRGGDQRRLRADGRRTDPLGYVRAAQAAPASPLQLSIRGKPHPAKVVPLPFVPHRYQR